MMISSKGGILGRQTRRHLKAFYPLKDKFGTDCRLQTKRQYVHATSTQYMSHVITSLPLLGDSKLSSRIYLKTKICFRVFGILNFLFSSSVTNCTLHAQFYNLFLYSFHLKDIRFILFMVYVYGDT